MVPQKLKDLVKSSQIQNKKQLFDFFGYLSENQLLSVLKNIEQDPNFLEFLSRNLQEKIQALQNKNRDLWTEILAEEKDFLENIKGWGN